MSKYSTLEEKLYNYSRNWPHVKMEILPAEVTEILDIRDAKIKTLQLQIYNLNVLMYC